MEEGGEGENGVEDAALERWRERERDRERFVDCTSLRWIDGGHRVKYNMMRAPRNAWVGRWTAA